MTDDVPENPWDFINDHDVARFGTTILDPKERMRWCGAILTGGLPYMWRSARAIREMIYDRLRLTDGANVLLIGESNESCGFNDDIRERIGEGGQLASIDIIEQARTLCFAGIRGANDKLGTWRYDYTDAVPDDHYDAIVLMQGVQHCENWKAGARDLLRVLKPGHMIVLAEITHGPALVEKAKIDVHLAYYVKKLYMGTGQRAEDFSYWSLDDLREAFDHLLTDTGSLDERGFEIYWGRKPQ